MNEGKSNRLCDLQNARGLTSLLRTNNYCIYPANCIAILDLKRDEFVDWLPFLKDMKGDNDYFWPLAMILNKNVLAKDGILVGYSMGGRIAMHMLIQDQNSSLPKWQKAIIISASAGLEGCEDRELRLAMDLEWSERFKHGKWDEVVSDWLSLPLFQYDKKVPNNRFELESRREEIALSMNYCSIARQQNLKEELASLKIPILFIAGSEDKKYLDKARSYADLNQLFRFECMPGAGHRAPWQNPNSFKQLVKAFVEN